MSVPTWLSRRPWQIGAIVLIWAIAYLPACGARDFKGEEGRRATPAREMLLSGNYVLPTLYGDPYLNKPPLFFWVIAGFAKLRGQVDEVSVRLPSAMSVLICALTAFGFARRQLSRETRFMAALMVMTSAAMIDKGRLGEIDTFLTAQVMLAWWVWIEGEKPDGQRWSSYVVLGVLMGVMALTKGPGGPLQFYLGLAAYLSWERKLSRLFSAGHLLCLLIAVVPVTVWVGLLISSSPIGIMELCELWMEQLGMNHSSRIAGGDLTPTIGGRYLLFPVLAVTMVMPWGIPLVLGCARNLDIPEWLWRFLWCCLLVPVLVLWAWPSARARYAMGSILPACVLSALALQAIVRSGRPGWYARGLVWWGGPVRGTVLLAGMIAVGTALIWSLLMPVVARWDYVRMARQAMPKGWSREQPLYTTLTFRLKDQGYYNLQFYLSEHLRAVDDLARLPEEESCTVLMKAEQYEQWASRPRFRVLSLGTMPDLYDKAGALHVVSVTRWSGQAALTPSGTDSQR